MKFRITIIKGGFVAFLFFLSYSCAKDTNCYATFLCRDNSDIPVANVKVQLYNYFKSDTGGVYPLVPDTEGLTDENGKISFTVKRAANYKYLVSNGVTSHTGLMQLKQGKETDKYFIIP